MERTQKQTDTPLFHLRRILELQKDRYFEALSAQFWNSSARGICPNDNDSEGITLQSLGKVFGLMPWVYLWALLLLSYC